jgi:hypothetical protein
MTHYSLPASPAPRNNIPRNCVVAIDSASYDYAGHAGGRLQLIDPTTGAVYAAPDEHGVVRPIDDAQFARLLLESRASGGRPTIASGT